jgi:hypothetical protein
MKASGLMRVAREEDARECTEPGRAKRAPAGMRIATLGASKSRFEESAMSKKKHAPHPVPPGNRTAAGPGGTPPVDDAGAAGAQNDAGAAKEEQDPQRRLGNFEQAGEHSFVQPGGKNDAQRGSGGM